MVALRRWRNTTSNGHDGNVLRQKVVLGEFRETDLEVAITESNRRKNSSFLIRVTKTGTSPPYQQSIPIKVARCYKNLFKERLTLEGPTGQTWTSVLHDFHNMVCFGKGWRRFSMENHLQIGYQLLFTLAGRFRFLVQIFDQQGKRCTSYPPLTSSQPGSVPVAQIQRQPDLQPGSQSSFQQRVDGGQASRRHGSEGRSSTAVPSMQMTPNAISHRSFREDAIPRQCGPALPPEPSLPHEHMGELEEHIFDAGGHADDLEMEDEELDDPRNDIFHGSDMDEATKQAPHKPARNIHNVNELSPGQHPKFHSPDNRAPSHQIPDHDSSPCSGDELPFRNHPKLQKEPVGVMGHAPAETAVANHHETGGSSGDSPAIRALQEQDCYRFSQIVLQSERRDVSERERRVVVEAAKRFVTALDNEMFSVLMTDEQVYHTFHLAIPVKMLQATGTERKSQVEVGLLDTQQVLYKTQWTRQNFCDAPLLDCDAWAKFAVDHTLEEGDLCVFQLLEPAASMPDFRFCVHIFRVVETPVGQFDFSDAMDNN